MAALRRRRLLHEGPALKRTKSVEAVPPGAEHPMPMRSDGALVLPYQTGSFAKALAAVATDEECTWSRQTFDERAVVASTQKSRTSRLQVWNELANQAGVQGPLTEHSVRTVVGALLRANYRSAQQYFGAAKRHHIRTYNSWDPTLDLIVSADVSRACARGLGPPSRSSPFPILSVANSCSSRPEALQNLPEVNDGPMHQGHFDMGVATRS